jgi:hypothetical protein
MSGTIRILAGLALVAIVVAAVPAAAQYNYYLGGKNKVRYDTFDWELYDTPHFRVSYYDRVEPQLDKIASFAESSYDELSRRLNFQVLEPIPLICYATHAEFEQTNIITGFIPEAVGAFASPVRNRMVLPVDLPDRELQALIQHELTHIFQYEILFQGRRGRAIYARPPQWFMEGMASYYGNDEDSRDEMYMRDAALSDRVPSIKNPYGGFLAYRYGHKVFSFIEDEWGEDTVRDFVFAFRNSLGGNVERPLKKVLNMDVDEFDAAFRSWLRRKYIGFADRGTPREYGRPFRVDKVSGGAQQISPVVSPSGDLVAAITTYKNDIDVAIFGVPDRRLYKNLTKGYTTKYEYLIAQGFTVGPAEGRDLAFSPDGNSVAVFARTARTRSLLLLDVRHGGIAREIRIPLPIDQPMQPAYRPDGRAIAFTAVEFGNYDIFEIDLDTEAITNLTADEQYDAAPTYSPDGRWLIYSSEVGDFNKLVRLDLEDRTQRDQLTYGVGNDEGAEFSPDGKRLYFASDRLDEVFDVYQLDLESRRLKRITYVIGAAVNPVVAETLDGERVGFQGYSHGGWDLYSADPNLGEDVGVSEAPAEEVSYEPFLPAVSISIDTEKAQPLKHHKLFLEDAAVNVGVDQDSNVLSYTYLSLSDQYGDRRINLYFNSIDTFSNFQASYINLEPRLQYGFSVYDYRLFYYSIDNLRQEARREELAYSYTAGSFDAVYPFSRYYRVRASAGYVTSTRTLPSFNNETEEYTYQKFSDNAPFVSVGLAGDTTLWQRYGPHRGSRWELTTNYFHDLEDSGALSKGFQFEGRKYLATSQRSELALRLFVATADGNRPNIFAFGGLDTVRGFSTRSLAGNQVAFANIEWRFPLIDRLDLAFMSLGGMRGRAFFDVGFACYDYPGQNYSAFGEPGCKFMGEKVLPDGTVVGESGRLTDGVAAYGFGLTINVLGLPMHWDFVKRWDFKETIGPMETEFWIGLRF